MDILKQTSFTGHQLSLRIGIENFPAFVKSKATYETRKINVFNAHWYVEIVMEKHCRTSGKYIAIKPESSEQPEILTAYVYGHADKDCAFDVAAKFKFIHRPTAEEKNISEKFIFNSLNGYSDDWGIEELEQIAVIFCKNIYPLLFGALVLLVLNDRRLVRKFHQFLCFFWNNK